MNFSLFKYKELESIDFVNNRNDNKNIWISSFDKITNHYQSKTAEIKLKFKYGMTNLIMASHCLEDDDGNDYFRLSLFEMNSRKIVNPFSSMKVKGQILNIWSFYRTVDSNYFFENFRNENSEFPGDALLFKLSYGLNLIVVAHTSIEEHEPRIDFALLKYDEFAKYEKEVISKWKFKDYL